MIRVLVRDGQPTGECEGFMTGFVIDNESVWGRPAGVAVGRDGALLVSDDGNGAIFRVMHGAVRWQRICSWMGAKTILATRRARPSRRSPSPRG